MRLDRADAHEELGGDLLVGAAACSEFRNTRFALGQFVGRGRAQIAHERQYELFSQGLRWEDLRRLGTLIGVQPKVPFLPMPQGECNTNPSAGC